MSYKIPLGFWLKIVGLLNIFYVDPLVVPIPTIQAQYGITIPVHTLVKKNRSLTFLTLAVDLHIIF
ncbi:MAG: hypothetical protein ACJZ45_05035 [Nitrospinia bacterium]